MVTNVALSFKVDEHSQEIEAHKTEMSQLNSRMDGFNSKLVAIQTQLEMITAAVLKKGERKRHQSRL